MTENIWCQWPDLTIPNGFKLTSKPLATLSETELSEITFYVPQYMAGSAALTWIPKNAKLEDCSTS